MVKCPDCNKFGACDEARKDITECTKFKKKPYMALVKVDGLNYKFEEVK